MTINRPIRFVIAAAWCVAPLALFAQENDREADHQGLRELKAVAEEAINTNNLELLRPHLDEPFSIVTYTDSEFSDFDAFQAQWQKTRDELLEGGSYTTKLLPERSQLFGDIAVCRGNSENVLVTGDGSRYEFESRWTAICRQVDGEWKIVRAHSSLNPFTNPLMKDRVKWMLIQWGCGALLVGLLVGFLLRAMTARRSGGPASAE